MQADRTRWCSDNFSKISVSMMRNTVFNVSLNNIVE